MPHRTPLGLPVFSKMRTVPRPQGVGEWGAADGNAGGACFLDFPDLSEGLECPHSLMESELCSKSGDLASGQFYCSLCGVG